MKPLQFYLYYPEEKSKEGSFFVNQLVDVKKVPLSAIEDFCRGFHDLGELAPSYHGFRRMKENFVLAMSIREQPAGFCVFILERIDILQIDIIVVAEEFRRRGWGKFLLAVLERVCLPGTVLYVEQVTGVGRNFFTGCGFSKDVNLFKIVGAADSLRCGSCKPADDLVVV